MTNPNITPEIRAQVLREAAEHIRRERRAICDDISKTDASGEITLHFEGNEIADECTRILSDMAAREEGRAAYLAVNGKAA